MNVTARVPRNKILCFTVGTIVIQGTLLILALIYNRPTEVSAKETVTLDLGTVSDANKVTSHEGQSPAEIIPNQPAASQIEPDTNRPDTKEMTYKVVAGDTLSSIWKKIGAPHVGSLKAAKAFKEAGVSLGTVRAGDVLELRILGSDIVEFQKKLSKTQTLILQGSSSEGYSSRILEQGKLEQERAVVGTIKSSFAVATANRAVPYDITDEFVDLFSSRVEFRRDLQPGDEFAVIYSEQRLANGELVSAGPIRAASLKLSGKMYAIVRYVGADGKATYFDENGQPVGNYFLRYPVQFSRISSVFTDNRLHPVLGIRRAHNGVDFAAPMGTPVRAVADGRVLSSGYHGGGGNTIKISHNSRYATAYLHLSKIAPGVRSGTFVSKGQIIGSVGMTGLATGPHLHFSLYDRGSYVDPLKASLPVLNLDKRNMITASYLQAAMQTLQKYHAIAQVAIFLGLEPSPKA